MVELGRCFVSEFTLGELPVGRHHDDVLWQKGSRQRYGCIKVATWVITKIKHQALELRVFLVNFFCLAGKIFDCSFLKLADPNPAIARLQELAAHRLGANFIPRDGDREAAILGFPEDHQQHFGVGLAPHAFDRLVEGQAFDWCVVNLADQVARLEPGAKGW